jgi:hypothetical protein
MIKRLAKLAIGILLPVFASFWLLRGVLAYVSGVNGWLPLWGPSPPLVKFYSAAFPFWLSQVGLLIACLTFALTLGLISGAKSAVSTKIRILFVTVLSAAVVLAIAPGVIGVGLRYFQWKHSPAFPWSPTPLGWYLQWSYVSCLHIALLSVPMNIIVLFSAYCAVIRSQTTIASSRFWPRVEETNTHTRVGQNGSG